MAFRRSTRKPGIEKLQNELLAWSVSKSMNSESIAVLQRREFLKMAGATSVYGLSRRAGAPSPHRIAIVMDAEDTTASSVPVRRAAEKLRNEVAAKGMTCNLVRSADEAAGSDLCILVAPPTSALAHGFPASSMGQSDESTLLASGQLGQTPALLVAGIGQRGFIYALLGLAERV